MKETVTIRRPDGTKKVIELNDESYITVELGKGGKPSVFMKLSKELVSTAPKAAPDNRVDAAQLNKRLQLLKPRRNNNGYSKFERKTRQPLE